MKKTNNANYDDANDDKFNDDNNKDADDKNNNNTNIAVRLRNNAFSILAQNYRLGVIYFSRRGNLLAKNSLKIQTRKGKHVCGNLI